ncbi:MAG: hypothetical protein LBB10_03305 [Bifidobacteriaceae bacterium]|jgi:hypothetical protein|nr:hypothetical protein [Bifidobacteriaceae bacterium]
MNNDLNNYGNDNNCENNDKYIKKLRAKRKADRRLKEEYRSRSLSEIIDHITNMSDEEKYVFIFPSDIEYERQKTLNESIPYKRTPKDILCKKAMVFCLEAMLGVRDPISIKEECIAKFFKKINNLYQKRKSKWENVEIPATHKVKIESLVVKDQSKISCCGLGVVGALNQFHAVVVELVLERFCWRIADIKVVKGNNSYPSPEMRKKIEERDRKKRMGLLP